MRGAGLSVVIVSRERPAALLRCLAGLRQQTLPTFEVVVVACPAGIAALDGASGVKAVPFDRPNISVARNLGIARAAGEIVAFIDDDAVPEPGWLHHVLAGFGPDIAALGGTVLGRNGISRQWAPRAFDARLDERPLPDVAGVPDVPEGFAVKTEGTNMAVRREVLVALGGFDAAYAFYLDETDLNLRLAQGGYRTALAPQAVVHHGFAPSARRRADRVPRTLVPIGASLAAFFARHAPDYRDEGLARERAAQHRRLLRHMAAGALMPGDVARLLAGFDEGVGQAPAERGEALNLSPPPPFHPFPNNPPTGFTCIAGRWHQRRSAMASAQQARARGEVVHLLVLSPTARPHWVRFEADSGIWIQSGGVFGRAIRSGSRWVRGGFRRRAAREQDRVNSLKSPLSAGTDRGFGA
ncbi:MAG: glycosyltransferase family 2 protein [Shimia sp.]